jgi:hypothetical protein
MSFGIATKALEHFHGKFADRLIRTMTIAIVTSAASDWPSSAFLRCCFLRAADLMHQGLTPENSGVNSLRA